MRAAAAALAALLACGCAPNGSPSASYAGFSEPRQVTIRCTRRRQLGPLAGERGAADERALYYHRREGKRHVIYRVAR